MKGKRFSELSKTKSFRLIVLWRWLRNLVGTGITTAGFFVSFMYTCYTKSTFLIQHLETWGTLVSDNTFHFHFQQETITWKRMKRTLTAKTLGAFLIWINLPAKLIDNGVSFHYIHLSSKSWVWELSLRSSFLDLV